MPVKNRRKNEQSGKKCTHLPLAYQYTFEVIGGERNMPFQLKMQNWGI